MKPTTGILKIIHGFPFPLHATVAQKEAIIVQDLRRVRQSGYDGIVTNLRWGEDYLQNDEDWHLLQKTAACCRDLGLRMWIYDEKGYPSGAAGTRTLDEHPELQAKALAALVVPLKPHESTTLSRPHGHLCPMGAFAYLFDGDTVSDESFSQTPIHPPLVGNAYKFENQTEQNMLCLAFFTKPAFEGTHAQHNSFAERRYIDLAHPRSGEIFLQNTYRPYVEHLREWIESGTVEAFFADEPSYLATYFNLKKQCDNIVHMPDPSLPLLPMVHWSDGLCERFFERYGYALEEKLPYLFVGNFAAAKQVRADYYRLLTELAEASFFAPIASFCQKNGIRSSGHILLEEKLSDHPRYEGNFFSFLRHMHVPGMDMLDSLPERVFGKAFTPLLVSSISKLYADASVMDEVSSYFQFKFQTPLSPIQRFNALALQVSLGATLFTSYYDDQELLDPLPSGESPLSVIHRILTSIRKSTFLPEIVVHYPIEAISTHTTSPLDVAHVWDSSRTHEYFLQYPIDRQTIDADLPPPSFIENASEPLAQSVERDTEGCMYALLNRQLPFIFCDTEALTRLTQAPPKLLLLPPQEPSAPLLDALSALVERGTRILALTDNGRYAACYDKLPFPLSLFDSIQALSEKLSRCVCLPTEGETDACVALWQDDFLLLVNSENRAKRFCVKEPLVSVTELCTNEPLPLQYQDTKTSFLLPPYGVVLAERSRITTP